MQLKNVLTNLRRITDHFTGKCYGELEEDYRSYFTGKKNGMENLRRITDDHFTGIYRVWPI